MFSKFTGYVFLSILSFSSALYAIGSGVLPLFDDGTVLVGKEYRRNINKYVWSDFGGGPDAKDKGSLTNTALREFKEETGHYSFPKITLTQVQSAPIAQVGSYEMRLVHVHGPKPSIQDIHKNAATAKKKLGSNAHVEKVDWKYVDARQLINAVYTTGILPGTNDEIFGPFQGCIKKPSAQQALQALIAAPKKNVAPAKPANKNVAPKKKQQSAKAKKSSNKTKTSKKQKTSKKSKAPKKSKKGKKK